jgi:Uncharacterized conserved protein
MDEPAPTVETPLLLLPFSNDQEGNDHHYHHHNDDEEEQQETKRTIYSSCSSFAVVGERTKRIQTTAAANHVTEAEYRPAGKKIVDESSSTLDMVDCYLARPTNKKNTRTTATVTATATQSRSSTTGSSTNSSSRLQNCDNLSNFYSRIYCPFLDTTGNRKSICMGLTLVSFVGIFLGMVMPKNQVLPTPFYRYISSMIGYTYFIFWCFSFYPQIISNYKRKSAQGLSADFCVINFVGYVCYAIYTSLLYWNQDIQNMYQERHVQGQQQEQYDESGDHGDVSTFCSSGAKITVQSNDVAFALHAVVLSGLWVYQLYYYGNHHCQNEKCLPSKPFVILIGSILSLIAIYSILVWKVSSFTSSAMKPRIDNDSKDVQMLFFKKDGIIPDWLMKCLNWLDFIYFLSLVKVFITLLKYIPQVMLNARYVW